MVSRSALSRATRQRGEPASEGWVKAQTWAAKALDGKPLAALFDARLFERIRRMQERFDALCDRFEQTYTGVLEGVALAEIERATSRAR